MWEELLYPEGTGQRGGVNVKKKDVYPWSLPLSQTQVTARRKMGGGGGCGPLRLKWVKNKSEYNHRKRGLKKRGGGKKKFLKRLVCPSIKMGKKIGANREKGVLQKGACSNEPVEFENRSRGGARELYGGHEGAVGKKLQGRVRNGLGAVCRS